MLMASLIKWQKESVTQTVVERGLAHEFKDWRLDSMLDAVDAEVDKIFADWKMTHGGADMSHRQKYFTRMAVLSRVSTIFVDILHVLMNFQHFQPIQ